MLLRNTVSAYCSSVNGGTPVTLSFFCVVTKLAPGLSFALTSRLIRVSALVRFGGVTPTWNSCVNGPGPARNANGVVPSWVFQVTGHLGSKKNLDLVSMAGVHVPGVLPAKSSLISPRYLNL